MKQKLLLSLFLILYFLPLQQVDAAKCVLSLSPLLEEIRNSSAIAKIIESKTPSIAAHGKNTNIAEESTWTNLKHAIQEGDGHISMLEVDAMMTKDGHFVIMHDPTFHRLVKDYQTSPDVVAKFKSEYPELAKSKEGQWDFNLFDESSMYTKSEIKEKFKIFDENSGLDYEFITLDEIINAVKVEGEFRIPKFAATPRAPPKVQTTSPLPGAAEEVIKTKKALSIYIDFKPVNNYTRRLYGLSDWHWIRTSWSDNQIKGYTNGALRNLSAQLKAANAHDKTFIAVRHPKIAKMTREIDPKINTMASPDYVTKDFTTDELIKSFDEFEEFKPKLIEIKYLKHILDPKLRAWAKKKNYKILYNEIVETDPTQFKGIYSNNLPKLLDDILESGDDIILQTNTVSELRKHFDTKYGASP